MVTLLPAVHARAIHHHRVVQHLLSTLFRSLHKLQKTRQLRDVKRIDLRKLCQHPRVAPVMRELMVILAAAAIPAGLA